MRSSWKAKPELQNKYPFDTRANQTNVKEGSESQNSKNLDYQQNDFFAFEVDTWLTWEKRNFLNQRIKLHIFQYTDLVFSKKNSCDFTKSKKTK